MVWEPVLRLGISRRTNNALLGLFVYGNSLFACFVKVKGLLDRHLSLTQGKAVLKSDILLKCSQSLGLIPSSA